MINLEKAISNWKKELKRHPGLEPGHIEELEAHLRDKIDDSLAKGLSEEDAFEKAIGGRLDDAEALASEYFRARSVGGLIPPWQRKSLASTLLPNVLKIVLRNIKRNKAYAFINITGLSLGIACCLILLGYVGHELSFDRFHRNADRIYRVNMTSKQLDDERTSALITAAVGPSMVEEFPEITSTVRLSGFSKGYFTSTGQTVRSERITYGDSTLFSVFSFNLLQGNEDAALANPSSIVLTRDLAQRLFPNTNPMGKTVTHNGQDELVVTGILQNPPSNSQLNFTAVISFNTLLGKNVYLDWNGGWSYHTYILLDDKADPGLLESKFEPFMYRHINRRLETYGVSWHPQLQPLTDIHLYSDVSGELNTKGTLKNLYLFSVTAFVILILACINFINLTTVQASGRSKEIGIRKVSGGGRKSLAAQFMMESIAYILTALIIAVFILLLFKPAIEELTGADLLSIFSSNGFIITLAGGLLVVTALIAGAYPAFYLSSLRPVQALKEQIVLSGSPKSLIGSLVVIQFAVSVILITATVIVYRQLDFIKNRELGYNRENVVVLPLIGDSVQDRYPLLKQQLKEVPGVLAAAGSSDIPGNGFTSNGYIPEGYDSPMMFHVLDVDPDYFRTMNIAIVEGRAFQEESKSDENSYLVNQALASELGWADPVGKNINRSGEHEIIGVVQDFNFATLHRQVEPLIFTMKPWNGQFSFLSLRISDAGLAGTLHGIQTIWSELAPSEPFDYFFLDQSFDAYYNREQNLGEVFFYFSLLTVGIGCMGLFGLSSYSLKKRTKEIGIRKVLGATTQQILLLVGKNFALLILISFVAATPIAYYLISDWLNSFAYSIPIGFADFILGGLAVFLIAAITIGWQSVKTARDNPVNSLRTE